MACPPEIYVFLKPNNISLVQNINFNVSACLDIYGVVAHFRKQRNPFLLPFLLLGENYVIVTLSNSLVHLP
jgi:hypothetical protein